MGEGVKWSFQPVDFSIIPKPVIIEYKQIFADINLQKEINEETTDRFVSPEAVAAALEVNKVGITKAELRMFLRAMTDLSKQQRRSSSSSVVDDKISFDAFARVLYAFSIQQREVKNEHFYAVFPDSSFTSETMTGLLRVRRDIWLLLEDPSSSISARIVSAVIVLTILFSTFSFCLETLPYFHNKSGAIFEGIETICILIFTIEFLLRISCTPTPRTYFLDTLNMIDLIAILPFFIELIVESSDDMSKSGMLRALRLIRVFRMLKVGRYLRWMRVFGKTLQASIAPLSMMMFIISISILLVSTLVYYAERGTWNPSTKMYERYQNDVLNDYFGSIPATFWWCIITMTTVGYGDVYPVTWLGRSVASVTFLTGIAFFAIPISVISGNFHGEYAHMSRLQALKEEHNRISSDFFQENAENSDAMPVIEEYDHRPIIDHNIHSDKGDTNMSFTISAESSPLALSKIPSILSSQSPLSSSSLSSTTIAAATANTTTTTTTTSVTVTGTVSISQKDVKKTISESSATSSGMTRSESLGADLDSYNTSIGLTPSRAPLSSKRIGAAALILHTMKSAANNARASVASRKLQASLDTTNSMSNEISEEIPLESNEVAPNSPIFSEFNHPSNDAPGSPVPLLKFNETLEKDTTTTIEAEAIQEAHRRIDLSWSEPFLRTALVIVRNSRRALTSHLKTMELRNREVVNAELQDFVRDSQDPERMFSLVGSAATTGLF